MAVAVVSVPVEDQIAARDFRVGTLGLVVMRDEAMGLDMRWIQLQPRGGASIALVTWFEGIAPGGMQGLMLGVGDVDAERARLSGLGVSVSPVEERPWGASPCSTIPTAMA